MREEIEKLQENIVPAKDQTVLGFYSYDDGKKGKKILFIGNSITKHRPKPEIGWENDCGMAASSLENDYVHQLMSKIRTVDSGASFAIQVAWEIENNKEKAANICGDKYTSLGDIPFRAETHGRLNHPSDLGMKEIAELMWETVKTDFQLTPYTDR